MFFKHARRGSCQVVRAVVERVLMSLTQLTIHDAIHLNNEEKVCYM